MLIRLPELQPVATLHKCRSSARADPPKASKPKTAIAQARCRNLSIVKKPPVFGDTKKSASQRPNDTVRRRNKLSIYSKLHEVWTAGTGQSYSVGTPCKFCIEMKETVYIARLYCYLLAVPNRPF